MVRPAEGSARAVSAVMLPQSDISGPLMTIRRDIAIMLEELRLLEVVHTRPVKGNGEQGSMLSVCNETHDVGREVFHAWYMFSSPVRSPGLTGSPMQGETPPGLVVPGRHAWHWPGLTPPVLPMGQAAPSGDTIAGPQ